MKLERGQRIVIVVVIALFVGLAAALVGVPLLRGYGDPAQPDDSTVAISKVVPQPVRDGQPVVLGEGSKPVQLFVDFHCPHCVEFEQQFGPALFDAARTDRIRLELYPMSFVDAGSGRAANAFGCATELGLAESYYRALFADAQLRWTDDQLVAAGFWPPELQPKFEQCVRSSAKSGWVDSINAAAAAKGVSETPTLFVAGSPVDLATLTPDTLQTLLSR